MRRIFTLLLTILLIFTMANTAFASLVSGSEPSATIPINANFSAQAISFEVTDSINANTSSDDPTVLKFSEFKVTNLMNMGYLEITKISATGENGWNVAADNYYDDWKKAPFDRKWLSILAAADGMEKTDLSSGGYTGSLPLKYGTSMTFDLSGHTGAVTQDVSGETVAKIITTISLKTYS